MAQQEMNHPRLAVPNRQLHRRPAILVFLNGIGVMLDQFGHLEIAITRAPVQRRDPSSRSHSPGSFSKRACTAAIPTA
jgi:hypothetical protein